MSIDKHVVAIALGQTVVWSGLFYTFPALLLRWEHSIGWSKSSLTGAISIALLLSAVAAPLAGRFIDAGKGPITMTASVLLGGLALFIVASAEQLGSSIFAGASSALPLPDVYTSLVLRWLPAHAGNKHATALLISR